jgi:hypothetical protein
MIINKYNVKTKGQNINKIAKNSNRGGGFPSKRCVPGGGGTRHNGTWKTTSMATHKETVIKYKNANAIGNTRK